MSIALADAIDPQRVLTLLDPILPDLCAAVVDAVVEAKEVLASRDILSLYDWNHHASTVRTALVRDLHDRPILDSVQIEHESSSGIHVLFGGIRIKLLKDTPELPIATVTTRKRNYYRQPEIQLALQFCPDWELEELRLVLYWQVDRRYNLRSLRLCCPTNSDGAKPGEGWSTDVLGLISHLLGAVEEQEIAPDDQALGDLDIQPNTGRAPQTSDGSQPVLDIQAKDDESQEVADESAGEIG